MTNSEISEFRKAFKGNPKLSFLPKKQARKFRRILRRANRANGTQGVTWRDANMALSFIYSMTRAAAKENKKP